jgi:hypothetical protein
VCVCEREKKKLPSNCFNLSIIISLVTWDESIVSMISPVLSSVSVSVPNVQFASYDLLPTSEYK